jgi:hypothetical protein
MRTIGMILTALVATPAFAQEAPKPVCQCSCAESPPVQQPAKTTPAAPDPLAPPPDTGRWEKRDATRPFGPESTPEPSTPGMPTPEAN